MQECLGATVEYSALALSYAIQSTQALEKRFELIERLCGRMFHGQLAG
jgi:hypothetical protein